MSFDATSLNNRERFDEANPEVYDFKAAPGLNAEIVTRISKSKNEPAWMLELRLKALAHFLATPEPTWGPALAALNVQEIVFFIQNHGEKNARKWEDVPADIKRTFERLGIPEAEQKSLAGAGAQYECLAEDTLVYTSRGNVPIKNIRSGDVVFAFDEQTNTLSPASVSATAHKGKRQVFSVKVGMRTIRATDNHPFLCLEDNRKLGNQRSRYIRRWKYLKDLRKGDLVAVSKKLPDEGMSMQITQPITENNSSRYAPILTPSTSSPELMWWLGLYLGDGFIHYTKGRKKRVEIAIPETEVELRQKLAESTQLLFGVEVKQIDANRVTVGGTLLAEFIEQLGFKGKALTKVIPDWVYTLPNDERLAFIAGYVDADGYIRDHSSNKDLVITSANGQMLEQVRQLVHTCSLRSSNVRKFSSRQVTMRERMMTGYRLFVAGDVSHLPFRNPRRSERVGKHVFTHTNSSASGASFRKHVNEQFGFVRIDAIEPTGDAEVYDIEVTGHHNFVAEGLIVHNSEMAYHSLKEEWEKQGVVFLDMDEALRTHEEIVKKHFMRCVPYTDHKYAALHGAVWSGGTFLYVPAGVKITQPLQAYFRMNARRAGQFEHTMIIVEEGAEAHYLEGCSAPQYAENSLHAGCVEVYVAKNARCRYSSVENWSRNTYNLNTKRALVEKDATMEWIGGNLGCLTSETTISTNPHGPIKIKNIQPGQHVIAWNSQTNKLEKAKVKAIVNSGEKEVFEVEVSGRKIEASANHPFLTIQYVKHDAKHKKGFFYPLWKPLLQLAPDDCIAIAKSLPGEGSTYPIPPFNYEKVITTKNQYVNNLSSNIKHLFKSITLPAETNEEFMWFLGIYLGDGHTSRGKDGKGAKINIAIHEKQDLRVELKETIKKLFDYEIAYEKERFIIINSVPLADTIKRLGFEGNADTKQIPEWVYALPKNQKLAFLAGYFDSDGHAGTNGIYFTSINKALLEGVKELALSCGIGFSHVFNHGKARRTKILGVECNARDSFRVLLNGEGVKLLPSRSIVKRSKIDAIKTGRNFVSAHGLNFRSKVNDDVGFAKITSIKSLGVKQTYDIEVEQHHNFVANGIIVHNSGVTMLYPTSVLKGEGARAEHISIAFAGKGQHQDTGAKVYHLAPRTTSHITSKSIAVEGGITTYRGLVKVRKGARGAKSAVECDALMVDNISQSNTYPFIDIKEAESDIGHEATIGRISDEDVFYLMSRGIAEDDAKKLIVTGFMEPVTKMLPMEYAVELNRLIELEMEGSLG